MKELILENGKARLLKNEYNIDIKIGRKNDKYFVICDHKTRGPFERAFYIKTNTQIVIIGYNEEESKSFVVDDNGLKIIKKDKIDLKQLLDESRNINQDNYKLIIKINDYSIFIDNKSGKLFAVNTKEKLKDIEDYPKFSTYEDLVSYSKQQLGVSLYDVEAKCKLAKELHTLIKFKDLYSSTINLTLEELPREILFDILTNRSISKKVFDIIKKESLVSIYGEKKNQQLIEEGYTELNYSAYDTISKNRPDEMQIYCNLLQKTTNELKNDIYIYLKQKSNINFDKLETSLISLSVNDLPRSSVAEITANRPLTKGIFMTMLSACFEKLKKEGVIIDKNYGNSNNFKVIYPNEYLVLWDIASKKLPELSKEYFSQIKRMLNS